MDKEDFQVNAVPDGWHVNGFLGTVTGAKLKKVIDSVSAPRDAEDTRTGSQRRVQGLDDLLSSILGNGLPSDKGVKPHMSVFVDAETLQAAAEHVQHGVQNPGYLPKPMPPVEPATLAGHGAIGPNLLMYFACVSDFTAFLVKTNGDTRKRRSSTPDASATNPTSCNDAPSSPAKRVSAPPPAATTPTWRFTTSSGGRWAAPPTSTSSSDCAAAATTCCTAVDSTSPATPQMDSPSPPAPADPFADDDEPTSAEPPDHPSPAALGSAGEISTRSRDPAPRVAGLPRPCCGAAVPAQRRRHRRASRHARAGRSRHCRGDPADDRGSVRLPGLRNDGQRCAAAGCRQHRPSAGARNRRRVAGPDHRRDRHGRRAAAARPRDRRFRCIGCGQRIRCGLPADRSAGHHATVGDAGHHRHSARLARHPHALGGGDRWQCAESGTQRGAGVRRGFLRRPRHRWFRPRFGHRAGGQRRGAAVGRGARRPRRGSRVDPRPAGDQGGGSSRDAAGHPHPDASCSDPGDHLRRGRGRHWGGRPDRRRRHAPAGHDPVGIPRLRARRHRDRGPGDHWATSRCGRRRGDARRHAPNDPVGCRERRGDGSCCWRRPVR